MDGKRKINRLEEVFISKKENFSKSIIVKVAYIVKSQELMYFCKQRGVKLSRYSISRYYSLLNDFYLQIYDITVTEILVRSSTLQ